MFPSDSPTMKLNCPNKCGMIMGFPRTKLSYAIKEMKIHTTIVCSTLIHNKPKLPILYLIHRPSQTLEYFTYILMKDKNIISKYTTWYEWHNNIFPNICWNKDWLIYESWMNAMKDTCMNIPCDECNSKEIERTARKPHDKRKLHIPRKKTSQIDEMQDIIVK